jgi:zona occludens toxin
MAIIAYTGVMGSGKTYEAVKSAALPALKAGRRVVTNISGFNYEAIRDYLSGSLSEPLEKEMIVVIKSARVTEPNFFYNPEVEAESVVKPGDLVLLDEVWMFWGTDSKLSEEHKTFFRMHRHYTEEGSGTSCDLVLMIQDLMSLHRFIRAVLESSYKFTKLKTLGLTSRYRVEVFEGRRQTRPTLVTASINKYDQRIFPLYKSYEGSNGKEKTVDGRQNLFRNYWFLSILIGSALGVTTLGWMFYGLVQKMLGGGNDQASVETVAAPVNSQIVPRSPAQTLSTASNATPAAIPAKDVKLVAIISPSEGEAFAVLRTSEGYYVHQRMKGGVVDGWQSLASHQGRMVGFLFDDGVRK